MSTYTDFLNIVDFSLIEAAVQALFVGVPGANFVQPADESDPKRGDWLPAAGQTAFYTNKNILVNQAARPRVKIRLHNINPVPRAYKDDDNGIVREVAWRGSMEFGVVTEPNYTVHAALRARVISLIPQVAPQIAADNSLYATTGINALLAYHNVSEFWANNVSTDVVPAEGAYMSLIPVTLAFSVNNNAWRTATGQDL